MVTAVISLSQRGDALRNGERTALHEASRQLTSTKDADRALAVEVAVAYAIRSRVEVSAQQTLLGAMHYEDSPFVVYQALKAFEQPSKRDYAVRQLIQMNRALWLALKKAAFDLYGGADTARAGIQIRTQVELLQRNRELLSRLLERSRWVYLNFDETFLPELSSPGATYTECSFQRTVLSYANFRATTFSHCNLNRAVLISPYCEETTFRNCSGHDLVLSGSDTRLNEANIAGIVPAPQIRRLTSFAMEFEHDWQGHWLSEDPQRVSFRAHWATQNRRVCADMILGDREFDRRNSSDHNDGTYAIASRLEIDPVRLVVVSGGRRLLQRKVAATWFTVWWTELTPDASLSTVEQILHPVGTEPCHGL
jgi:hypothetical protein